MLEIVTKSSNNRNDSCRWIARGDCGDISCLQNLRTSPVSVRFFYVQSTWGLMLQLGIRERVELMVAGQKLEDMYVQIKLERFCIN
jgi:hypothetical protein